MSDDADFVSVDRAGGVLTLTFNRPALGNALSAAMIASLTPAFEVAAEDRSLRAMLVRGAGPHFCAGGDISDFRRLLELSVADRQTAFAESMAVANAMMGAYFALDIPVVVACQGVVAGGGVTFALAADVVLADASTRLLFSHQRIGLPPDGGVSALLPGMVGERRARELVLTAATLDVDAALRLGLVSRIVNPECLLAEATSQAERFSHAPADAARAAKRLLRAGQAEHLAAQLAIEREAIIEAVGSPDFEEGVRAFLERRSPRFPSADQIAAT